MKVPEFFLFRNSGQSAGSLHRQGKGTQNQANFSVEQLEKRLLLSATTGAEDELSSLMSPSLHRDEVYHPLAIVVEGCEPQSDRNDNDELVQLTELSDDFNLSPEPIIQIELDSSDSETDLAESLDDDLAPGVDLHDDNAESMGLNLSEGTRDLRTEWGLLIPESNVFPSNSTGDLEDLSSDKLDSDNDNSSTEQFVETLLAANPPPTSAGIARAQPFVFDMSPSVTEVTLRVGPSVVQILDAGTVLLAEQALAATSEAIVNGSDEIDDTLTVEVLQAHDDLAVTFHGGDAGFDTLVIGGGGFSTSSYAASGPDAGTIVLDSIIISYSGLEPIVDHTVVDDRVFTVTTSGIDHQIRIGDDGDPNNGYSMIDSNGTGGFESIAFPNPAGSLTVVAGDGNDTILLDHLDSGFGAPIFVNGETGNDTLMGSAGIDAVWTITSFDAGTVGTVSFSGIENLFGAVDNEDTFVLEDGGRLSGLIEGGQGGFDTLVVEFSAVDTMIYRATGPQSGSIVADGNVIAFSGLEPIDIGGTAEDLVLIASPTDDNLVLEADPSDPSDRLRLVAVGTMESPAFDNPDNSLKIIAGAGNDIITVEPLPDYDGAVIIEGGSGNDTIVAQAAEAVTLTNNLLTIGSESFTLNNDFEAAILSGTTVNATGFRGAVLTGLPTWDSQGPGPVTGGLVEGIPDEPVTGAIEAIAPHPTNPAVVYVGTVGGGIWKTTNYTDPTPTWEPVTDQLPSLGITALAFDPTGNILYAGTGKVSSSSMGGKSIGLLKTVDGGRTWSVIGKSFFSEGRKITSIVASNTSSGPALFVATAPQSLADDPFENPEKDRGGLFRSLDGFVGNRWENLSRLPGSGLSVGAITDLEVDPANPDLLYVALVDRTVASGTATTPDAAGTTLIDAAADFNGTDNVAVDYMVSNDTDGSTAFVLSVDSKTQLTLGGLAGGTENDWDAGDRYRISRPGGVFRTDTTAATIGHRWIQIDTNSAAASAEVAAASRIELSVSAAVVAGPHPDAGNHPVYLATIPDSGELSGVFRSSDMGATWQTMSLPGDADGGIHPGTQGLTHFSLLADRTNPHVVYVGGDTQPGGPLPSPPFPAGSTGFLADKSVSNNTGAVDYNGRLFLGDASTPDTGPGSQWTSITNNGAPGAVGGAGTAPHADSRAMVFDLGGNILEADDGGIYRLVNLNSPSPLEWQSVNGNLSLTEFYSVAWNSASDLILGGSQDNGVAIQSGTGSSQWEELAQGDGAIVYAVGDDYYYSTQRLGGFIAANAPGNLTVKGKANPITETDRTIQFIQPYAVNVIDPTRILIGTNFLYESEGGTLKLINPVTLGTVTSIVYGGREPGIVQTDEPDIGYIGTDGDPGNNFLWVRQDDKDEFDPFEKVTSYTAKVNAKVRDIAIDPGQWRNVYVLTEKGDVWFSADGEENPAGNWTWTNLTKGSNLKSLPGAENLQSIVVDTSSGTPVILVGGLGGVFRAIGHSGTWTEFGAGLPNALVTDIDYDKTDGDVLLVGTLGRGAWTIESASETLAQTSTLVLQGSDSVNDVFHVERNSKKPWLLDVFLYRDLEPKPDAPSFSAPLASIESLDIQGKGLNDRIVIDFSNGPVSLPLGISIDGGSDINALQIDGPPAGSPLSPTFNTGIVSSGSAGFHIVAGTDSFGHSSVQSIIWSNIQTAADDACVMVNVDSLRDGLELASSSFQNILADATSETVMAGIDPASLASGLLNGLRIQPPRPKDDAFMLISQVNPEGFAQIDDGSSFLRRLFEEGLNAFDLSDIATDGAIPDPATLRQALDDLDTVGGNVTVDEVTDVNGDGHADLTFDVQILKELSGIIDLDVDANVVGSLGDVHLTGALEVAADIELNLVFGVDSRGFFIIPNAVGSAELKVKNLIIDGQVSGQGSLGFLGVDVNHATLSVDPDVEISFKLSDPETDLADGLIRVPEFSPPEITDLISWAAVGDPTDGDGDPLRDVPDVVFTGDFEVSALLPGVDSGITLATAQLELAWANIEVPEDVQISAGASPGPDVQEFLNFLEVTSDDILSKLADLKENLDRLLEVDRLAQLGVDVTVLEGALDKILNLVEAFDSKVIDPLTSSATGGAVTTTAQEIAVQIATEIGIDPADMGLSYDKSSKELTYDLTFTHDLIDFQEALQFGFDFEPMADLLLETNASFTSEVTVDLTLGVDLGDLFGGDTLANSFFIRDASLSGNASFSATGVRAKARLGFIEVEVEPIGGDPATSFIQSTTPFSFVVALKDPDGTQEGDSGDTDGGRITLQELLDNLQTPLSLLEEPDITGGLEAQLPLGAPFLGIAASAATTATITLPDITDPASLQLDFPDFSDMWELRNFNNLSAAGFVSLIAQIASYLDGVRESELVSSFEVPFAKSALDAVLDVADAFRDVLLIDDEDDGIDQNDTEKLRRRQRLGQPAHLRRRPPLPHRDRRAERRVDRSHERHRERHRRPGIRDRRHVGGRRWRDRPGRLVRHRGRARGRKAGRLDHAGAGGHPKRVKHNRHSHAESR